MLLQLPWKEFVVVIICIDFLVPFTTSKVVKCKLENEVGVKCQCKQLRNHETPWPKNDSATAPMPRNASMKMKNFHGEMFPRIRWKLERQYIKLVDGFYVEVYAVPSLYFFYHCKHDTASILKKTPHNKLVIEYQLENCCRSLQAGFCDGQELFVKIYSLPMYGADETNHYASASLTVGGEPDNKMTEEFGTSLPDPEYYMPVDRDDYDDRLTEIQKTLESLENKFLQKDNGAGNVITVVAIIATIIICSIGVCILLAYLRNRPLTSHSMKKIRRLLLIGDEEEHCIKLINELIEVMKKSSNAGIDVVSNIRKTSEIASIGIVSWMTENFNQSDIVVMLISESSQLKSALATEDGNKSFKKSPVTMALNVADSEAAKINFRTLKKKLVLVYWQSVEVKSLPYCSHYILKKHFKEILKHVLGYSYDSSVDVKEDYKRLLTIANQPDPRPEPDPVYERVDVRRKTTRMNLNNLDVSLSTNQVELTSRPNDFSLAKRGSDYPSVENNEEAV